MPNTWKYRYFTMVEVNDEDAALRLKAALQRELPGLEVFAEVDKEDLDGEIQETSEIL